MKPLSSSGTTTTPASPTPANTGCRGEGDLIGKT
nr:MAG TPA: hypothetical protein [Caudoviricetes sp.]